MPCSGRFHVVSTRDRSEKVRMNVALGSDGRMPRSCIQTVDSIDTPVCQQESGRAPYQVDDCLVVTRVSTQFFCAFHDGTVRMALGLIAIHGAG